MLKSFYFKAKQNGVPPTYHLLSDEEVYQILRTAPYHTRRAVTPVLLARTDR